MRRFFQAACFMGRLASGGCGEVLVFDTLLDGEALTLQARVFRPREGKPVRGTILSVIGLSVHGNDDARMDLLNRAMARAGFIVVSPSYDDIISFRISSETIDHVVESVRIIVRTVDLSPYGSLSIIAPSFSGGICLSAAARSEISPWIKAVCTIGGFSNVREVLHFLMGEPESDDYGRMIILKNFIHYHPLGNSELAGACETAYLDNGFSREVPELPAYLAKISRENRDVFMKLQQDSVFRMDFWSVIEKKLRRESDLFDKFHVFDYLDSLACNTILIHGEKDNVIPSSESVNLHREILKRGRSSFLAVTPLISHGDTSYRLSMLPELLRLVNVFNRFFKCAESVPVSFTYSDESVSGNDVLPRIEAVS